MREIQLIEISSIKIKQTEISHYALIGFKTEIEVLGIKGVEKGSAMYFFEEGDSDSEIESIENLKQGDYIILKGCVEYENVTEEKTYMNMKASTLLIVPHPKVKATKKAYAEMYSSSGLK